VFFLFLDFGFDFDFDFSSSSSRKHPSLIFHFDRLNAAPPREDDHLLLTIGIEPALKFYFSSVLIVLLFAF
jgi:hypothetical protein